jgi:ferric-dicitrate binding protein FerR (iron transport regulator)
MADIHQIRAIAGRIMEQTATAQELKIFREYLAGREEHAVMNELFIGDTFTQQQVIQLDEAEKQQMLQHILGQAPQSRLRKIINIRHVWPRVAAVLLLCGGGYAVLKRINSSSSRKSEQMDIYTAYGQQKVVRMPDSTKIILNAGSHINYVYSYTNKQQEVFLEGEAFFEVTTDAARTFVVHSGELSTTVLGTSFNVRAYKADPAISVQVKTGKVQVALSSAAATNDAKPVTLLPAQQVTYAGAGNLSIQDVNAMDIAGWTTDKLIFNDQPVTVILNELERVYNIHFNTVNKTALTRRYTIRLKKMPLTYMLETVSVLTGLQFQAKDSMIVIR